MKKLKSSTTFRKSITICAALIATSWPSDGYAQSDEIAPIAPNIKITDSAGVNLASRMLELSITDIKIGSEQRPLVHTFYFTGSRIVAHAMIDNFTGGIQFNSACGPNVAAAGIGGRTECFSYSTDSNGHITFTALASNGSTLVDIGYPDLIYTTADGTKYYIDRDIHTKYNAIINDGAITKIARPDGLETDITWNMNNDLNSNFIFARIEKVERNDGLGLSYSYKSNTLGEYDYLRPEEITTFGTNSDDYYSAWWPSASYTHVYSATGDRSLTVKDMWGGSTEYEMDSQLRVISVRPPYHNFPKFTYIYCPTGGVSYCTTTSGAILIDGVKSATRYGYGYNYTYASFSQDHFQNTSYGPDGSLTVSGKIYYALPLQPTTVLDWVETENGANASFSGNMNNRLASDTLSTKAQKYYYYNNRGGVTSISVAGITTRYEYPPGCTNSPSCNKPTKITDPKGYETNISYDLNTGMQKRIVFSAVNGVSKEIIYNYTKLYAAYQYTGIWLLTSDLTCINGSMKVDGTGCQSTGDQITTTYSYESKHLYLREKKVSHGNEEIVTCYTYSGAGALISETAPKGAAGVC